MSSQHYHFVFFVSARDLRNGVVGGFAFGIPVINDIELKLDRSAVRKNTSNPSVIFVTHHYGRKRFCGVECSIVKSADLTMLTARIIDSDQCAACNQELIQLLIYLSGCQFARFRLLRLPAWSTSALARVWIVWVVTLLRLLVFLSARGRINCDRDNLCFSGQDNLAVHFVFLAIQVSRELLLRRLFGKNQLVSLRGYRAVGSRGPGEHFTSERILHRRVDKS